MNGVRPTHYNWYPLQLVPVTTGIDSLFTSTYRLLINKVMTLAAIDSAVLKSLKGYATAGPGAWRGVSSDMW